jgi:putative ABC transport system permease protein
MGLIESVKIALGMLKLHKFRAFLTMLGVIIGVMSVSLIVIVVNGFQSYMKNAFSGLAADGIYIVYDPSSRRDGEGAGRVEGVTEDDKNYILAQSSKIRTVSGIVEAGQQTVKSADKEIEGASVSGVDANNNLLVKKDLIVGRLISDADVEGLANVAVVSEEVAKTLYQTPENAIGQTILLPGITLEIIGVIETPPQIGGPPNAKTLEIPVTTAQRKWVGGDSYTWLMARAAEGVTVNEAMDEVWEVLMRRTNNVRLYRVDSNEAMLGTLNGILGGIGVVLAGIAALSLLVGGIGIMNIMLVSVTERTREIGLRKAVGAKKGAVLTQFLVESAMLSLVGGLIGMGLAFGLGLLVTVITKSAKFPNEDGLVAAFPLMAALGAASFSAMVGVVFGFFPAVSASRLDPIVALRYE